MLTILHRIAQEVGTASNLDQALAIAVRRVKESIAVDVCSVYLADPAQGNYVLVATDGLNPVAIGEVRLSPQEGLVGLVGERQELLNLDNAAAHPRYRYFPETGEERYHAFLGVPLVRYRQRLGVLVVQQRDSRLFSEDETAFVVTIAAQLAGAIEAAAAVGATSRLLAGRPHSGFLKGVPAAPGVGVGTVVLPSPFANLDSVPERKARDPAAEEAAFAYAVRVVQTELQESGQRMATLVAGEAQSLFDVYTLFLDNDWLFTDTVKRIRAGQWAPGAWRDTIVEHAQVFETMEDPYLRTRAEDIRAIGRRVLMRLQNADAGPRQYPDRCVLVGEEVSVARIAEVPLEQLAGIVSLKSSALSHTAILARALGVPAVMGLGRLPVGRLEGADVAVDGYQGRVFIQPTRAVLEEFQRLVQEDQALTAELQTLADLPAQTPDNARLELRVNAGLLADLSIATANGAEGVGLYRTEFPFMIRQSFPGEDEQTRIYREVLETMAPLPVTMRSLDVGGDKPLDYFPVAGENNPFLGWRGIRLTLDHPDIFRTQLRALLRANIGHGNLQLLLPMISRLSELDEALALLKAVQEELNEEGLDALRPPVGAMVEVPSAVYLADRLAERVEFLSIGSNDLTQYLLAVDRNNHRVSDLYDSLHPAVLNAIREVVDKAHSRDTPVSLCGEMASDPAAVVLLLGMGLDGLSVSSASLPRVKWVVRSVSQSWARELLEHALTLDDGSAIRGLLNQALKQAGLGGLVRMG